MDVTVLTPNSQFFSHVKRHTSQWLVEAIKRKYDLQYYLSRFTNSCQHFILD